MYAESATVTDAERRRQIASLPAMPYILHSKCTAFFLRLSTLCTHEDQDSPGNCE
jgi:hypothetical protein